jgi:hypothetical protein
MAIERRVLTRKGSHLVAIPARVRDHLKVHAGAPVYWRVTRKGEAVLSRTERPARGPERAGVECPSCAAYEKHIARLHAQWDAQKLHVYGMGYSARALDEIARRENPNTPWVHEQRDLDRRWRTTRSRSARRKDARAQRPRVETIPAPSLSSPSESTG